MSAAGMGEAAEKTWFGQPRGLTILFLTNMWEQFSYFGMRALLVYYMTKQLLIEQTHSSYIYGAYTSFAYFTPIIGGAISDRWLGKKKAVIIGASVMAAGHFMMAFESLFYFALATIAIGNGLFLPSLPSQINDLYGPRDPRRGWAYNVYYVGINIGAFLAPLICGTLGEVYGWHYGFGAAGIGMVGGLIIYLVGGRYLPPEQPRGKAAPVAIDGGSAVNYRSTYAVLLAIGLSVVVFRGAYEQIGNTIALWADTGINRMVGDFEIRMTWFIALNPLLVMVMTPFLLAHWRRKAEAGRERSPMQKMAIGALIIGSAYGLLAIVSAVATAQASWIWLVLFFFILTFGELYILPTGLGLFARLAPPRAGATTVGSWFLVTGAGSLFAGFVGSFWSSTSRPVYFACLFILTVIAAGLLLALDRSTRKVEATRAAELDAAHES
ncbi:peptide MFS transporter [Sphingosinicella rhizophila]|uniref:Peptide MFS transporter n=1 Tax=Sphingosinicella rhizophila TaxID=3050082 RepID=A0ABU3Q642_9SPHN|nr:peptide MFS transporter [Sphingosinicella sp. GR2756]MDT9598878.1 peptide MFS transporter [Sphingosinicella sp. GR2756]